MQTSLLFSASALSVVFQPREVHGSWQQLLLMCSGFLLKSPLISSQALSHSAALAARPGQHKSCMGSPRAAGFLWGCWGASPSPPLHAQVCRAPSMEPQLLPTGWPRRRALHRAQHIPTPELLGSSAGCAGAQPERGAGTQQLPQQGSVPLV